MSKPLRPLIAFMLACGLGSIAPSAFAVGATCPDDSASRDVESQYQGGVLRCIARARANAACPPTHPQKVAMPPGSSQDAVPNPPYGATTDFCRPLNLIITAPSQAAQIVCPPGMSRVVRSGADICRATATTQLPPVLIPN